MNKPENNVRWPLPELVALALFPIPFRGPDILQRIYGRLPEFVQMVIPFVLSGFVVVSAVVLSIKAIKRKLWWRAFVSFSCFSFAVFGTTYAVVVMVALGSNIPLAVAVALAGLVAGAGVVTIEQILRSAKVFGLDI